MNINERIITSTFVERQLVQLRRGFKRCHDRFPSIYHELWEPQVAIEDALPDVLKPVSMDVGGTTIAIYDEPVLWGMADSFRKANAIELSYLWTRWHEPDGARYFGCFYGEDGAVWDDFVRLAGSAYLVLRQIDTSLPDGHFHGWMKVVHAMACGDPTPLLRSHSVVWRDWECESAEDHERWIMPRAGAPYPEHPVRRTLELDVITSSMAAIERLLDGKCVSSLGPPMPEPLAGQEDRNGALSHPTWDPKRRELRFGNAVIKRFRQPAANQEAILSAFEEEQWPERIDDPLPGNGREEPKRRLRDTVHSLNSHHTVTNRVRFEPDGTGEGVLWELL